MRLLLDECVDERIRHLFAGHDTQSARYAGLAALKNGVLLLAAENAGFEAMITVDQGIPYQQNLRVRRISVVILAGPTNRLSDLKGMVPSVLTILNSIVPGQVVTVRAGNGQA